jgi:chromate reductase, NAD(P)H dehydrogenase (quinone)
VKVAIISASPRKESNSIKVASYLKSLFSAQESDVSFLDFEEIDIPMLGRGSLDKDNLTPFQQKLVSVWGEADLVIFAIPEYNWLTSGEFINMLHQVGTKPFAHLFNQKVFALVGVSTGRGGRRPCLEMTTMINKLISFLNQYSIISPKLFESHETGKNLDDEGSSTGNGFYEKGMDDFVNYTLRIARQWHGVK